jgi:opacity protein-like surface antigen
LHNEKDFLDCCCLDGRFDRGFRGGFSGCAGQGGVAGARDLLLDRLLCRRRGRRQLGRQQPDRAFGGERQSAITGNFDLSGGIAGGTVGCNVQVSNFVLGIENDYSWTNKSGSAPDQPPFAAAATSATREKWIDTLRGRFGYAIDRFMVYGTAGVAFAGT